MSSDIEPDALDGVSNQSAEVTAAITSLLPKIMACVDPVMLLFAIQRQREGCLERALLRTIQIFLRDSSKRSQKLPRRRTILGAQFTAKAFKASVDYSLPLEEILVAGKYHRVNKNIITDNFLHDQRLGRVEVEFESIQFHYPDIGAWPTFFLTEVLEAFNDLGLRPATLVELCAVARQYTDPRLPTGRSILALGSVWKDPKQTRNADYRYIPALYLEGKKKRRPCLRLNDLVYDDDRLVLRGGRALFAYKY